MKTIKNLLLALLFIFFGCQEGLNTNSPEDTSRGKPAIIALPASSEGFSTETIFSYCKEIPGTTGGTFKAEFSYPGGLFGQVTVSSILEFPAGSFTGNKIMQQQFDNTTASVVFGPSCIFSTPVLCTIRITGVDLRNINSDFLDFVYISPSGSMQRLEYEYLTMDINSGTLYVQDVKLYHFSRYAFVN